MTRWFQTKLAAPMLVAAWCVAGGWHMAAQGPTAGEHDDARVPGAGSATVRPETVGYSSERLESLHVRPRASLPAAYLGQPAPFQHGVRTGTVGAQARLAWLDSCLVRGRRVLPP